MLRMIAILLSQLILLQSMHISVSDFSNFSTLLDHAEFHKENYGDNFVEFVIEHYVNDENARDSHHHEHKDLPFKNEINQLQQQPVIVSFSNHSEGLKPIENHNKSPQFFYKEPSTDAVVQTIFQPPKHS